MLKDGTTKKQAFLRGVFFSGCLVVKANYVFFPTMSMWGL